MNVAFDPAAESELDEAVAHYAAKSDALGQRFRSAVENGIAKIGDNPNAWNPMGRGIRRYRLSRFPYGLVYRVDGDVATIYAVMHLRRRPRYWRSRLS